MQQKGDAYNDAYAKDYGQYQEHLNRLDTLYGYYAAQEQQAVAAVPEQPTLLPQKYRRTDM